MTLKDIASDPRNVGVILAFLKLVQDNAKKKDMFISDSILDVIGQLSEEVAKRSLEVCSGLD